MEIVLGRHGRPEVAQSKWIAPRRLGHWITKFNDGGIRGGQIPQTTSRAATHCKVIVASPLRRSYESAQLLASSQLVMTEDLIREADMPHPSWWFPVLPIAVWLVIFRIAWYFGYSRNAESRSDASMRAKVAADRLVDLSRQHDSIFVVGHGIMTALIARRLLQTGWSGPRRPANAYWGYCVYRSPTSR
jgi:broad specificity phosphatase PhoE